MVGFTISVSPLVLAVKYSWKTVLLPLEGSKRPPQAGFPNCVWIHILEVGQGFDKFGFGAICFDFCSWGRWINKQNASKPLKWSNCTLPAQLEWQLNSRHCKFATAALKTSIIALEEKRTDNSEHWMNVWMLPPMFVPFPLLLSGWPPVCSNFKKH